MDARRSNRLKAFVKFDSRGQIVPNVLVLRNKKPGDGGNWKEIDPNLCCLTVNPAAPTAGVVDDKLNTFNWTYAGAYTNNSDYEYTTDSGATYAPVTAKPITGLSGARAVGTIGVRIRTIGGTPAGDTLYSETAYTAAPAPATSPVVDDVANTFDWTNNPSYTALGDYEYTLDSGTTYATVTAKPLTGLTGARAAGSVGVRVKAANGDAASTTIYNATPYTV